LGGEAGEDGGGRAAGFGERGGTDLLRRLRGIGCTVRVRPAEQVSGTDHGLEDGDGLADLGLNEVAVAGGPGPLTLGDDLLADFEGLLDLRAFDPLGVLEGVEVGVGVVECGDDLAVAGRGEVRR
jgi:hypothetical protein